MALIKRVLLFFLSLLGIIVLLIGATTSYAQDNYEADTLEPNFRFYSIKWLDIPDKEGNTALHYSIKVKDLEIFKEILSKDPDVNQQTNQGESALHIACNFTQISVIEELLKIKTINTNIQDYENQITPLMYSIILDDIKLFNLLINLSDISSSQVDSIMFEFLNSVKYIFNDSSTKLFIPFNPPCIIIDVSLSSLLKSSKKKLSNFFGLIVCEI